MKLHGNTAHHIIFDQKHSQIIIRREGGTMGNNSNPCILATFMTITRKAKLLAI